MIATKAQAAARSAIPETIRPQIVASARQPPTGTNGYTRSSWRTPA